MIKFIEQTLSGNGDSDRHAMALFGIALGSRGKTFIELGVRNGNTTLPLLHAAAMTGGVLHSVDNFTPVELIKTINSEDTLKKHWKFYTSDAIEFLENFKDDVDLVYVDDWHSYEHVKHELDILDKIVTPSTIILLHDAMYGETCPYYHCDLTLKDGQWGNGGVYRAIAELNQQFWEFSTLPWNNGLTILRKKYTSKYKRK